MTVKEIAELCGVEDRTVRNWCHFSTSYPV